ncbi:MAG: tyrosine-type recombinase/integrase [Rhodobacteraceae bacterium]|nr:tyrosine-type recombinase/integrase [Paracoccaceae bacterium]
MKRLRMLLNFTVDVRMITANPIANMKGYQTQGDGFHTWTEAEIEQFVARYPPGTKVYLALMLMLCTGQRKCDARALGWKDVDGGPIAVRQQKTDTPLVIPVTQELGNAIANLPAHAPAFLLSEYGKPFSVGGFGNWMRKRCDEAGLPQCSSHGLREACARRLAEAGCTVHEIKAITGHKSDAEVRRYTEKSDQILLSERALEKLQKRFSTPNSANHPGKFSKHEAWPHVSKQL